MRFAILLVAGLIGWLWYATHEPTPAAPPAPAHARRADLGDLHAQVAAAATHARTPIVAIEAIAAIDDEEVGGDSEAELEEPASELEEQPRDADLSELFAQLEAATEANDRGELVVDVSHEDTRIFVDGVEIGDTFGHEIIAISGSAPLIDPTSTSTGCTTIEIDYTRNIPIPRTFEGVLGAAAGSQGQEYGDGEGVSISSNHPIENVYVIDGAVVVDDVLVEDHVIED